VAKASKHESLAAKLGLEDMIEEADALLAIPGKVAAVVP